MAGHEVVIDHADGLHEGIHNGRSAEFEPATAERLGDFSRQLGLGRNLFDAAQAVDARAPVDVFPEQFREAGTFLHDLEPGARGEDRAFDLHAVANGALVLHQPRDLLWRIARDLCRLEGIEGAAKIVAFAQNDDPRKAGLESVEHQLLIERAVVVFRNAPFLVMIGEIEWVLPGPRAAREAVGLGSNHSAVSASPGKEKRAQRGLTGVSSIPPAASGSSFASASSTRSSRNAASPRPPRPEPIRPTFLSPAVTARPASGGGPSKVTGTTRVRAVPRWAMREITSCPTKQPLSRSRPASWSMSVSCGKASP